MVAGIAAANGRISSVTENNLGGKVMFMRPAGKDFTLYYAHLDEQLVSEGQDVRTGDTIGLVGNTGNARTTPPTYTLVSIRMPGPLILLIL
jgi:murein DD-endopeptidase MepM/ murein hydrolase activator NlpD